MAISPDTCERITSSLSRLLRTGRHISARAAAQLYGELPSFGWALLVPLEREGEHRCSALAAHAGVDEILAATDPELEAVEGVGDMRAKDIREGLRRLQEIILVDRYLQT